MCPTASLRCWFLALEGGRKAFRPEGCVGLCWASCPRLPSPLLCPTAISRSPEALQLSGCQIILGRDFEVVEHWILVQLEGRGGLDSAKGSCLQPHLQSSQMSIAPEQEHLALWYVASSLLKLGTPHLGN